MSRYELQKLYRKICKKSPEVYGNEDLWMENMADADYVYAMIQISDTIDVLKERIEDKQEDSAAVENFKAMCRARGLKKLKENIFKLI